MGPHKDQYSLQTCVEGQRTDNSPVLGDPPRRDLLTLVVERLRRRHSHPHAHSGASSRSRRRTTTAPTNRRSRVRLAEFGHEGRVLRVEHLRGRRRTAGGTSSGHAGGAAESGRSTEAAATLCAVASHVTGCGGDRLGGDAVSSNERR